MDSISRVVKWDDFSLGASAQGGAGSVEASLIEGDNDRRVACGIFDKIDFKEADNAASAPSLLGRVKNVSAFEQKVGRATEDLFDALFDAAKEGGENTPKTPRAPLIRPTPEPDIDQRGIRIDGKKGIVVLTSDEKEVAGEKRSRKA